MAGGLLQINPELPYEERRLLLWRRYMRKGGWIFLDVEADNLPKQHEAIVFSDGNQEEFLIYTGYYDHPTKIWEHQNEPCGQYPIKNVTAWMPIHQPEKFNVLHAITGNDFLALSLGREM